MNDDAIKDEVLRVLMHIVPEAQNETVNPGMTFRDQFEIDSLDFLNFVLTVENALDVKVPETAYPRLGTLDGAVEYLAVLLAEKVD